MPRYEIIREGIRAAYGNTGDTGVFLSVYEDEQLRYETKESFPWKDVVATHPLRAKRAGTIIVQFSRRCKNRG